MFGNVCDDEFTAPSARKSHQVLLSSTTNMMFCMPQGAVDDTTTLQLFLAILADPRCLLRGFFTNSSNFTTNNSLLNLAIQFIYPTNSLSREIMEQEKKYEDREFRYSSDQVVFEQQSRYSSMILMSRNLMKHVSTDFLTAWIYYRSGEIGDLKNSLEYWNRASFHPLLKPTSISLKALSLFLIGFSKRWNFDRTEYMNYTQRYLKEAISFIDAPNLLKDEIIESGLRIDLYAAESMMLLELGDKANSDEYFQKANKLSERLRLVPSVMLSRAGVVTGNTVVGCLPKSAGEMLKNSWGDAYNTSIFANSARRDMIYLDNLGIFPSFTLGPYESACLFLITKGSPIFIDDAYMKDLTFKIMQEKNEVFQSNCWVCGQKNAKKCSACKRVCYCGKKCQVDDWENYHKYYCKLYRNIK